MIPIGDEDSGRGVPLGVWLLIATNVYVFSRELGVRNPDALINSFATIPYDVTHWIVLAAPSPPLPFLTLITSQFFHDGFLHLGFNMLFLFVFGPGVEALMGMSRFLLFYLSCGVLGGIAQISIDPASHIPSIGASGAIAGVLGGYIVRYPTHRVRTIVPIGCLPVFVSLPAILVIGLWAISQFVHGFGMVSTRVLSAQSSGIAYFAHVGGFLAGVFLVGCFAVRRRRRG